MTRRIALCHEWITTFGGSEQVASRLAEVLEVSDVYSFVAREGLARDLFGTRDVRTCRFGRSDLATEHWRWLLPAIAAWWRSLDLSGYEAVITSSHSVVNSVRAGHAAHISYCYTPMRYAWLWRNELARLPLLLRPAWPVLASALRLGDRRRAKHVDLFIADSRTVAQRIRRAYHRGSVVVYPPVDTDFFVPDKTVSREGFFLCAGRLVAYKRHDIAVRAANQTATNLVIAGSGPELPRLRRLAGPTVEFHDQPSQDELRDLYRRARALVFPGIEDFGMVPVEAQACGTPVVALAEGGALESVIDGETGILYRDASVEALSSAMLSLDESLLDVSRIRTNALRFSSHLFDGKIRAVVGSVLDAPISQRATVIRDLENGDEPTG